MDSFGDKHRKRLLLPRTFRRRQIICKGCGESFTVESDRIKSFCPDCRCETFNQILGRKIKEMEGEREDLIRHYRAADHKAGFLDQVLTLARDMHLTVQEVLQRLAQEDAGSGGSSGGTDPGSPAGSRGKGARCASVRSSTIRRSGSEKAGKCLR
jgi:predicted  nucleic acid-binding Zn-ribbon protein